MKIEKVYVCEFCKQIFGDIEACERCEATHFGLTYDQYKLWRKLLDTAQRAGIMVRITYNQGTKSAFEDAIQQLVDFEARHNLKCDKYPSHWK